MEKGSLSIDQIILIVIGMIVLVLAIVFLTNISGQAAKPTIGTAQLYSDCSSWRLFGYSTDTTLIFKKESYPGLWQTYLSGCLNDKNELDATKCNEDAVKDKVNMAKSFCTMEKSSESAENGGGSGEPKTGPVTADNPSDACIQLGFKDGSCSTTCATGYTEKGTTPCKNSKKLCCK